MLVNNTKSLLNTTPKGISMHCLVYEKGIDFFAKKVVFKNSELKEAIK